MRRTDQRPTFGSETMTLPPSFEQIEIAAQNADRPGEMFEDVGEDDDVEAPAGRATVILQIGVNDFADARARHRDRLGARLDSGDAVAALCDVLRSRGEAAADVEHVEVLAVAPEAEQAPVDVLEVLVVVDSYMI